MGATAEETLHTLADLCLLLSFAVILYKIRWLAGSKPKKEVGGRTEDLSYKTQWLLAITLIMRNCELLTKPKKHLGPLVRFGMELPHWKELGVQHLAKLHSNSAAYSCLLKVLVLSGSVAVSMSLVARRLGGHRGAPDPMPMSVLLVGSLAGAAAVHSFVLHEDVSKTKPEEMFKTASWQLEVLALLPQMFIYRLPEVKNEAARKNDNEDSDTKDDPVPEEEEEEEDEEEDGDMNLPPVRTMSTTLHFLLRGASRAIPAGIFLSNLTSSKTVRRIAASLSSSSRALPTDVSCVDSPAQTKIKTMVAQLAGVITSTVYSALVAGGDSYQQKLLRLGLAPLLLTFVVSANSALHIAFCPY
eukprot:COSAG05_NODE_2075_length_3608_cov_4.560274_3_plen_358_part_00